MNVMIDRDQLIEHGKILAKLEAIEHIIENKKYDSDAIHAIKCVLDMFEEEEEE